MVVFVLDRIIEADSPRILPPLTDVDRPFWTGGAQGQLLIQRCTTCARWTHPPTERCAECGGMLKFAPVSGAGTLFTLTVNFQQFHPDVTPPYVIAIVQLDEQNDLRIPTNIVNCDAETLQCGMPVRVLFEPHGDVFVPVFEPAPVA
jgi:uncharacterized OB-fold protein